MLFDIGEVEEPTKDLKVIKAEAYATSGDVLHLVGESVKQLKATIGERNEGDIVSFWTNRSWSVHDMLYYLSDYVGEADLYMTAWTVTDKPAKVLYELKESGRIRTISCLMDYRIHDRQPKILTFFKNLLYRQAITQVHAKVFVLVGKTKSVCITTSGNFTQNVRIESGVVFFQTEIARWNAAQILKLIRKNDTAESRNKYNL